MMKETFSQAPPVYDGIELFARNLAVEDLLSDKSAIKKVKKK